jgi:1,4-alpha-glucan branching enzyme
LQDVQADTAAQRGTIMTDEKKPRTTRTKKTADGAEPVAPKTPRTKKTAAPAEALLAEEPVTAEVVASTTPSEEVVALVEATPVSTGGYTTWPLTDDDVYLFNQGTHYRLYEKMGAVEGTLDGVAGVYFAVWAPNAQYIAVIGDFNNWDKGANPLQARGGSGIWQGFVAGATRGLIYKFHVASRYEGYNEDKTDPFGVFYEVAPKTAAVVWDRDYDWADAEWMAGRGAKQSLGAPMSIYEVHIGSWMRVPEEGNRSLSYRELAPRLAEHVKTVGFTHVEFLPVKEHPFFGSWGYQVTGYFAPTSRYGTPQDFMYLVDYLHQQGIGVILDWVPSHFPTDGFGLSYFDGTHLFEHADPRKGFHPDWGSYIFNYGRNEVRSFLISSALCWLDKYHIDGLRVDAVASMLYLDYSRKAGEWIPNEYGGNENIEAIMFLRQFNSEVYKHYPDVQTMAEESTAWPMVSRPLYVGGLGFGMKWDMGWMHDTLKYFQFDPIFRRYHHNMLTFRGLYAFTENFVLPLSHDEVVHAKGSILDKMSGDTWQKFANLRLLYSYMYATPAKKLLFMGSEFGQWGDWRHDEGLPWHLLNFPSHRGVQQLLSDLNRLYKTEPALHELDFEPQGFEWIDANDADASVYAFLRKGKSTNDQFLVVFNATPIVRENYRVGVPRGGWWREMLNSDAQEYWGSGVGNAGGVEATPVESHGRSHSVVLSLPPLSALLFKHSG